MKQKLTGDIHPALVMVIMGLSLIVSVIAWPVLEGYFGQFDLPAKLHTPKLDSWKILASGDLYILSYPTACRLSIMKINMTSIGTMTDIVSIACPSDSYVAVMTNGEYAVFCNSTTVYEDWNTVDGYYGYVYVYRAKVLLCKLDYS